MRISDWSSDVCSSDLQKIERKDYNGANALLAPLSRMPCLRQGAQDRDIRTGATRLNADSSLQCRADAGFGAWLAASGGSLAVTTYQAHKLLLIGWNGRQLSFLPRDRNSVVKGRSVSGRVLLGGGRVIIKKNTLIIIQQRKLD